MRFDRAGNTRRRRNEDERILPLINVVFLLLIFFMLAGRLAATDPFEIAPPASESDGPVRAPEMRLLVGADGRLALDGEVLSADAVMRKVAARVEETSDLRLQMKADAAVEANRVVALMERLREAGLRSVVLMTAPKAG